MDTVAIIVKMPRPLKEAAEAEAARRGIALSALIKNYLASFLPADIGNPISGNKSELRP